MERRRPAMKDVAARAGVSLTTVSHVLSDRRPVAADTRRRVLEAIEELGFQPNKAAQSLMTRRTQAIGLIVPDITNPFYPSLARGMLAELESHHYAVIIGNTDGRPDAERSMVEQMLARGIDGIAFAGYREHDTTLRPVIDAGVPAVAFGPTSPLPGVDVVGFDDFGAGRLATSYLQEQGRKSIVFVAGPESERLRPGRLAGYLDAIGNGMQGSPWVVHAELSRDGGAAAFRELLTAGGEPDGVVTNNDIVALGVLDAAREKGVPVPESLAVVGFDDIEIAALVSPPLTTVRVPAVEEGRAAARLLMDRLTADGGVELPPRSVVFAGTLVPRASA
jgi:LacI family transcriptional regulator